MREDDTDGNDVTAKMTRVLIVDDHRMFADAFERAIASESGMESAGVAGGVSDALDLLAKDSADVVLMDVHLPEVDGIEGTRLVKERYPDTRVVVMTGDPDLELMSRAAIAGACGFIPKASPLAEMLEAIRTARDGGLVVDPSVLPGLLGRVVEPAPAERHTIALTDREQEVLALLGQGLDPAAIAKKLYISIHTSRGYVKKILLKLQAHSQLEAVVKAVRLGLIKTM